MKILYHTYVVVMVIALLMTGCSDQAYADIRCCTEVKRYNDGRIVRSIIVLQEFKRLYPLPVNLNPKDFHINHAVPLACGGLDIVENLIWMHVSAKACAEDYCQDRHEQLTMCQK